MVMGDMRIETDLLVVGAGPGGYAAAFRAADLGMDVTMVDTEEKPGGVCLHRGCIPSKTLLQLSTLIQDARGAAAMGVRFGEPEIDLAGIRAWKEKVIGKLAGGLLTLAERRNVQLFRGRVEFESSGEARVFDCEINRIKFGKAIIATGSRPIPILGANYAQGNRIMSSSGALALAEIPESLLIVGGGYVGLEMGTVYAALGSRITLLEQEERLLPRLDEDLVEPLARRLKRLFGAIHLNSTLTALSESDAKVSVSWRDPSGERSGSFDRVLLSVGRHPNTSNLGLENTQVTLDEGGFIRVNEQQRTTDERIYAAGDVTGGAQLAHKASREGKVAAEVISGKPVAFDVQAMPAVIFTDPQIAWCGLTEMEATARRRNVRVERFPWKFSGRAQSMGASEGLTKLVIDTESGRILGVGICGREAEGLVGEGVLAIEMGALAEDMALIVHPHPTLSETEGEAAEIFLGSATHILPKKRKP